MAGKGNFGGLGETSFQRLRKSGLFFADNSEAIRVIEDIGKPHVLLCRPPGFGKSTFISMLDSYYDEKAADDFPCLFQGESESKSASALAIGKAPTKHRNSFKVLLLNLAVEICSSAALGKKVNAALSDFKQRYQLDFALNELDYSDSLQRMSTSLNANRGNKLLILIDNYDDYLSKLLFTDTSTVGAEKLEPLVRLFECLKNLNVDRIEAYRSVTLGVIRLPLATSSSCDGELSFDGRLAESFGLRQQDMRDALGLTPLDAARHGSVLKLVEENIGGYSFFGSHRPVVHPRLALRFLDKVTTDEHFRTMVEDGSWQLWSQERLAMLCDDQDSFRNTVWMERRLKSSPVCVESFYASFLPNFEKQPAGYQSERLPSVASKHRLIDQAALLHKEFVAGTLNDESSVLQLLLEHGFVTFEPCDWRVDERKHKYRFKLRVPNAVVEQRHFAALKRNGTNKEDEGVLFWKFPNADTLFSRVWHHVLEPCGTKIYRTGFNSLGICGSVEATFRFGRESLVGAKVVSVNVKEGETAKVDCDMQLADRYDAQKPTILLVFEYLERRDLNELDVKTTSDEDEDEEEREKAADEEAYALLKTIDFADFESLTLSPAAVEDYAKRGYGGLTDVRSVIEAAKGYARDRARTIHADKVLAFVMVVLLKPMIVESVAI